MPVGRMGRMRRSGKTAKADNLLDGILELLIEEFFESSDRPTFGKIVCEVLVVEGLINTGSIAFRKKGISGQGIPHGLHQSIQPEGFKSLTGFFKVLFPFQLI